MWIVLLAQPPPEKNAACVATRFRQPRFTLYGRRTLFGFDCVPFSCCENHRKRRLSSSTKTVFRRTVLGRRLRRPLPGLPRDIRHTSRRLPRCPDACEFRPWLRIVFGKLHARAVTMQKLYISTRATRTTRSPWLRAATMPLWYGITRAARIGTTEVACRARSCVPVGFRLKPCRFRAHVTRIVYGHLAELLRYEKFTYT